MAYENTPISLKVPASLREKMEERAKAEERSLSGFIRYHIGQLLAASEAEAEEIECETATVSNDR